MNDITTIQLRGRDAEQFGTAHITARLGMLRLTIGTMGAGMTFGAELTPAVARELAAALVQRADDAEQGRDDLDEEVPF